MSTYSVPSLRRVLEKSNVTCGEDIVLNKGSKLIGDPLLEFEACDWDVQIHKNFTRHIDGTETAVIGVDYDYRVGRDAKSRVGRNFSRTVGGSETADVTGDVIYTIGGDFVRSVAGTEIANVTGEVQVTTPVFRLTGDLVVSGTVSSVSTLGAVNLWSQTTKAISGPGTGVVTFDEFTSQGDAGMDVITTPDSTSVFIVRSGLVTITAEVDFFSVTDGDVFGLQLNTPSLISYSNLVRVSGLASVTRTLLLNAGDSITLNWNTNSVLAQIGGPNPTDIPASVAQLIVTRIAN